MSITGSCIPVALQPLIFGFRERIALSRMQFHYLLQGKIFSSIVRLRNNGSVEILFFPDNSLIFPTGYENDPLFPSEGEAA